MNQSKIYVGNLSYDVTSDQLSELFAQYGEIEETKLITDFGTGRSKGFAFVTFTSPEAAEEALKADGTELEGRALRVNVAQENNRRGGGGGGGRGGNRGGGNRGGGGGGGRSRW